MTLTEGQPGSTPDSAPLVQPLDEKLDTVVGSVARAMRTPVATLYIHDRQHNLVVAATRGLPRSAVGFVTLAPGQGVSGRAALHRRTLSVPDVTLNEAFLVIPGFDQSGLRSILATPVHSGSTVIGVLNVQTEHVRDFSAEDITLLESLAVEVAEVIDTHEASAGSSLQWRGPNLLATLRGMVGASHGPIRVGEEVIGELSAVLPDVECAILLTLDDGTHLLGGETAPVLGRLLLAAGEAAGRRETESAEALIIPLGGVAGICGYLGLSNASTGQPAWVTPAVRTYVASVAEHLGSAIDRMLRRIRSIEESARAQPYRFTESSPYADFVSYVLEDRGLDALISHARDILATPIAVLDDFGELLAGVRPDQARTDIPISVGDGALGRLLAGHSVQAEPVLETLAHVVTLELSKRRASYEVETRLRGDVLDMLMSDGEVDPVEAARRANFAGLSLSDAYRPVSIDFQHRGMGDIDASQVGRSLRTLAYRLLGRPPLVAVFARPNGLLLLVHETVGDLTQAMNDFAAHLETTGRIGPVGIGIGRPVVWPTGFARGITRTILSAGLARRLGESEPISVDRLGIYGLLLELDESSWRDYVSEQLGALLEQDHRTGAELVRTLDAYHRCGERLKPTSDALFIHANTLKYRLARIDTVTQGRFSSPTKRFEIYVALYILRLLGNDLDPAASA